MAMGANKFATMLHRNTNKITTILIYVLLEWILILLLLLNSLFSHLITKFAIYFGLKPPCPWCSRVDHCFKHPNTKNSYQDLVCEIHASEISQLGYCSQHKKLARNQYMCKDCAFSQPFDDTEQKLAFLSCIPKIEDGETNPRCSCCDASLGRDLYPPYILFENEEKEEENGMVEEHKILSYVDEGYDIHRRSYDDSVLRSQCKEIEINEDDIMDAIETTEMESIRVHAPDSPNEGKNTLESPKGSLSLLSNSPIKLENWSDFDDHFEVTIESIDSPTFKEGILSGIREVQDSESQVQKQVDLVETAVNLVESENNTNSHVEEFHFDVWKPELEYMNKAECNAESVHLLSDQAPKAQATQDMPFNNAILEGIELIMMDSDEFTGIELPNTVVGRGMSDQELTDQTRHSDPIPSYSCLDDNSMNNHIDAGNSTSSTAFMAGHDQSIQKAEEVSIEARTMSGERKEDIEHHLSKNSELNNAAEEMKSQFEKKESRMEESLDGCFISEMSSGEANLTIDHLKSVLKEERKARCALYEELEAERSANAVAAKHTMEMITRLQEEKATMRMEALQYQRMMDEQSEYDQEALQLLNELVVKVEKEKHELQMELETTRKKVLHYEAKERRTMKRKTTSNMSRTHSASFSNSEDGDHLPVDFDHVSVDEDSCNGHPESSTNTPANGVLNIEDVSVLDESLADFEAEKLSILEKLKELEEKLFTLSDEEGEYYEDIKPVVLFPEENDQVLKENGDSNCQEPNGNGFSKEMERKQSNHSNGFHLDTNGVETLDVIHNEEESISVLSQKNSSVSKFTAVNKRLAIEEEVDNVYERLQALEADREFLKQSISSLKKGDKGMDLLQEILQYLRDLRSVELCNRRTSEVSLA